MLSLHDLLARKVDLTPLQLPIMEPPRLLRAQRTALTHAPAVRHTCVAGAAAVAVAVGVVVASLGLVVEPLLDLVMRMRVVDRHDAAFELPLVRLGFLLRREGPVESLAAAAQRGGTTAFGGGGGGAVWCERGSLRLMGDGGMGGVAGRAYRWGQRTWYSGAASAVVGRLDRLFRQCGVFLRISK